MKTPKAVKFQNKADKQAWIAAILDHLAVAVRAGRFGSDGCSSNKDGYHLSDVVADAECGFPPPDFTINQAPRGEKKNRR